MKIGIVGAGKVGTTLGKYLTEAGVTVTGFYSRTRESAANAAAFSKIRIFETMEALALASDTLFLTTPDGVLEAVWDYIAAYDLRDKVVCHFSGSLSSEIFHGIEETGAFGCSIHPMYAFSDKFTSYKQFHTARLTMEGDAKALDAMRTLFGEKLGHQVFFVKPESKIKYHLAAALASNYVAGLMQMSVRLLKECGFTGEEAVNLLTPLAEANLKSVLTKGPVQALTGPVERNDVQTVQKHISCVQGQDVEAVYKDLGKQLVQMAMVRNPDRDYTQLISMMEGASGSEDRSELQTQ